MARRGDTTEYAELISLLEHVLSPATDDAAQPPPTSTPAAPAAPGIGAPPRAPARDQAPSPAARESTPPASEQSISPSVGITGLLAAALPIGIAILEAATLRVLRTNAMLLHMTGSDERPESAVGKRIDAVAPLLASPVLVAALQRAAATRRDYTDMLADARTGRRPAYLRCSLSPMGRGEGARDTVLLTLQDVSEQVRLRQRAEQGAGLAEEQLNARVQDALRGQEGRVRELEVQLRGALEEKHRLEETTREAVEAARTQYAQLVQAQAALGRLRDGGAAPTAATAEPGATTAPDGQERAILAVAAALAASAALPQALSGAAQAVAEALGDICAIFLRDSEDKITPAALYHRDPLVVGHLRAHFLAHPIRPHQGPLGQAAYDGERTLSATLAPPDLDELLDGNRELGAALGAIAAAYVPLPGAGEPLGALLLLSTTRARGGSERRLDGGAMAALSEAAGLVALAARNERLHADLAALEALHQVLLHATPDGVALYDRAGRLRQTNHVAEHLLTPPHGGRGLLQGFLTPDGQPLSTEALPWMRALRGETVGMSASERLVAVWEGNLQRTLLVRALPVRTGQGAPEEAIAYALVLLRADKAAVPPPWPRSR